MLCLWHFGLLWLLRFWFQADLGRDNFVSYLKIQAEKSSSYHGHALVTLYVQFLSSDWSKFDNWVHAENLCGIWKVVYFDSWRWQSFVFVFVFVFIYLPHDYNNYKKMRCDYCIWWRGGLKETTELMLIRPPQLQFFEDGVKITATDTI